MTLYKTSEYKDEIKQRLKLKTFKKYGIFVDGKLFGGCSNSSSTAKSRASSWLTKLLLQNNKTFSYSSSLVSILPLSMLFGGISFLSYYNEYNEFIPENEEKELEEEDSYDGDYDDESITSTPDEKIKINILQLYNTSKRFNHSISQVDISRMARNASKHLNVRSILSLPTYIYESSDTDATWCSWQIIPSSPPETQHCVICLEAFQNGDVLRELPCKHAFHIGCIDHWLLGTYSYDDCVTIGCPTCKKHAIPSWSFAQIGNVLAHSQESQQYIVQENRDIEDKKNDLDISSLSCSGFVNKVSK